MDWLSTLAGGGLGFALGGPIGGLIGAGLGGAAGNKLTFGSSLDPNRAKLQDAEYLREQVKRGIEAAKNRQAPQLAEMGAYQAPSQEFRQGQQALIGQLGQVASGQAPGAGELAVQRQAQRAIGNAIGASTMARGGNAVNAARAAARASGGIGLSAAGASQRAAMEDQSNARQLLGSVLGQSRGQDLETGSLGLQARGQDLQAQMANLRARLEAMGANDVQIQNYMQQLLQLNGAEMNARMGDNGLLPGLLNMGGSYLGMKGK